MLFLFYSYHRPSPPTHYSASESTLTGPLRYRLEHTKVYTGIHLTTRLQTPPFAQGLRHERTAPRPVVHAQPHPYADLIRVLYHPCAHSSTVSPHLVVSNPVKSPSFPSIPSDFTPRCHSILSPDSALFARRKYPETETEVATPSSRSDIWGNLGAHICRHFAPQASTALFSLLTCSRANFTCMLNHASFVVLFVSVAYIPGRTRLVSRPELQRIIHACEAVGTESAQ